MRVEILEPVQAQVTETDTKGTEGYIVGMLCGGLMECPERYYMNRQLIWAESEEEACEKYNKLNDCNYYYGAVICKLEEARIMDEENYKKYRHIE